MVMVVGGNRQRCSRPCRYLVILCWGLSKSYMCRGIGWGGGCMIYISYSPSSIRCMIQHPPTLSHLANPANPVKTQPTPANRPAGEIMLTLFPPPSHPKTHLQDRTAGARTRRVLAHSGQFGAQGREGKGRERASSSSVRLGMNLTEKNKT